MLSTAGQGAPALTSPSAGCRVPIWGRPARTFCGTCKSCLFQHLLQNFWERKHVQSHEVDKVVE